MADTHRRRIVAAVAALTVLVAAPMTANAARSTSVITVRVKISGQINVETPGKITFSPSRVKAGSVVTFRITNADPTNDHVFEINGRLTKFIQSGGQGVLSKVTFKSPGRYTASSPDDDRGTGGIFVVTG